MRISPTMNSRTAIMTYKSLLARLIFSYKGSIPIFMTGKVLEDTPSCCQCQGTILPAVQTLDADREVSAAELQQKLGDLAQNARDLAYRLYSICERKGWTQEALAYNSLVTAWPRLKDISARSGPPTGS